MHERSPQIKREGVNALVGRCCYSIAARTKLIVEVLYVIDEQTAQITRVEALVDKYMEDSHRLRMPLTRFPVLPRPIFIATIFHWSLFFRRGSFFALFQGKVFTVNLVVSKNSC